MPTYMFLSGVQWRDNFAPLSQSHNYKIIRKTTLLGAIRAGYFYPPFSYDFEKKKKLQPRRAFQSYVNK